MSDTEPKTVPNAGKKIYSVSVNLCGCHPETCCCDTWRVTDPKGEDYITTNDRTKAQRVASALTLLESHEWALKFAKNNLPGDSRVLPINEEKKQS